MLKSQQGRYLFTNTAFAIQMCQPKEQNTLCFHSQWGSGWHIIIILLTSTISFLQHFPHWPRTFNRKTNFCIELKYWHHFNHSVAIPFSSTYKISVCTLQRHGTRITAKEACYTWRNIFNRWQGHEISSIAGKIRCQRCYFVPHVFQTQH